MSTSPLRHNLRHCTYDGIAATPIVYLLQPVNFIIAALLVGIFQLTPATYGLIASLPFWGNFAQAFLMPLVNRAYSPKAVSVASSLLQTLCWAVMAVMLSFLPVDQPEISGRWFVAFFAISAAVTALTGVSWMSWVQEWVPVRLRGKYFGRRNRLFRSHRSPFSCFRVGCWESLRTPCGRSKSCSVAQSCSASLPCYSNAGFKRRTPSKTAPRLSSRGVNRPTCCSRSSRFSGWWAMARRGDLHPARSDRSTPSSCISL